MHIFGSRLVLAFLALAMCVPVGDAVARTRAFDPCAKGCVTLRQSADGLVVATAVDAAGNVLVSDTARVGASGKVRELYWPANDLSQVFERVDGGYVPVVSMEGSIDETSPLPGGGYLIINHQDGYDVIIVINPDGTIFEIRIQPTPGSSTRPN
ncbi:MAG: hypothetical protein COZ47_01465 [Lysobacterales bacterium CG_4_10_14_3_um_filter_64_11]|nr:MAG: hypothetical protein COZ47_01465 [Xanthomonadales bacterium CG_4_10_14_3_um_filter_64_11]